MVCWLVSLRTHWSVAGRGWLISRVTVAVSVTVPSSVPLIASRPLYCTGRAEGDTYKQLVNKQTNKKQINTTTVESGVSVFNPCMNCFSIRTIPL